MSARPVLLALFALTCFVAASPITSGGLKNDCKGKAVDAPCMLGSLDSLGLGLGGTCKEDFVSGRSDLIRNLLD